MNNYTFHYRPDPCLINSGLDLFDRVSAAHYPMTITRFRHNLAAATIGLGELDDQQWIKHFGLFNPLTDNQAYPLALRYHGHQFQHYNKDLGDGRGFLFAQLRDNNDRLLDLGTKGSGTTPYSRGGDGRLTLKGGVREALATTMLNALGVNTSKTLSLIETGEALVRGDEPSPTRSCVMVRLSHSHIRFGTFERLAYLQDTTTMHDLVDYCLRHYYPNDYSSAQGLDKPTHANRFFDCVVTNTAKTCAAWMAAGFVHGVLNTDNMNITGESFDYGPYRFLPYYDPQFTAAYFDHQGLYAYGRQPQAVAWNLGQLAKSLSLIGESHDLINSYNDFHHRYQSALNLAICARLNLKPKGFEADLELVQAVFTYLKTVPVDGVFEGFFFDWFGGELSHKRALAGPRREYYNGVAFSLLRQYMNSYQTQSPQLLDNVCFQKADPETLLINEIEAIWAAIDRCDDWQPFDAKIKAIQNQGHAYSLV